MSYMTFSNCSATNGSCVYAKNVNSVTINYTTVTNCNNLLKMGNNEFKFQIGTLILNNNNAPLTLIDAENETSYQGSNTISFTLYAPSSFDPQNGLAIFRAITYCFVYIHNLEEFNRFPVDPPYDARDPLEEVDIQSTPPQPDEYVTNPSDESIDYTSPSPSSVFQPTNFFSESQSFTGSDLLPPAAAAGAAGGGSGLSTVAIIFIVIACLIVVVGIIIFVIFYLRSHGRCQCSKGGSLAGMKNSTYF